MYSQFRPLTIHDLVLDPTLDPSPIAHSMPPKERLLPGVSVLVTGSLLGLILVIAPTPFNAPTEEARLIVPSHTNYFDIMLDNDPSTSVNGGNSGGNSPSPRSSTEGNPSIQTRVEIPSIDLSSLALSATDRPLLESEQVVPIPFTKGDGIATATATGRGNMNGDGHGAGGRGSVRQGVVPAKPFDYDLVPAIQARASYSLKPGESCENTSVETLVTVEDNGMVSQVQILSGPECLYPSVIAAARRWRFEPLHLHGLKGPKKVRICFVVNIT